MANSKWMIGIFAVTLLFLVVACGEAPAGKAIAKGGDSAGGVAVAKQPYAYYSFTGPTNEQSGKFGPGIVGTGVSAIYYGDAKEITSIKITKATKKGSKYNLELLVDDKKKETAVTGTEKKITTPTGKEFLVKYDTPSTDTSGKKFSIFIKSAMSLFTPGPSLAKAVSLNQDLLLDYTYSKGSGLQFTKTDKSSLELPAEILHGKTTFSVSFWALPVPGKDMSLLSAAHILYKLDYKTEEASTLEKLGGVPDAKVPYNKVLGEDNELLVYLIDEKTPEVYLKGKKYTFKWDTPVADGKWHHFVVTRQGSGKFSKLTLFIDGKEKSYTGVSLEPLTVNLILLGQEIDNLDDEYDCASGSVQSGHIPGTFYSNEGDYCLDPSQAFVGVLDEIKFFDSALTAAEVKGLQNQGYFTPLGKSLVPTK